LFEVLDEAFHTIPEVVGAASPRGDCHGPGGFLGPANFLAVFRRIEIDPLVFRADP
jgi:hypothetical protein